METKDAVLRRIYNLANEKHMMLNSVANNAGITPSTLYSITNHKQRDVKISTIKKLCDGFGITLGEFFDDDLFSNLD